VNVALLTLISIPYFDVNSVKDAVLVGLFATLFPLGSAFGHNLLQEKRAGLVLLDHAFNVLVWPLAAIALYQLRALWNS